MSAPIPITDLGGYRDGLTVLALQDIWRRMTKPQRRALTVPGRLWHCRLVTCDHLRAKGLVDNDNRITELGRAVVRWRPRKDA